MRAVFVELPVFERHRRDYLDDEAFRGLQDLLLKDPEAGDLMPDTGGLRKLRFADTRRGKGREAVCGSSTTGGMPASSSGFSDRKSVV